APQHLEEQPGAPPRGVLLLPQHMEARAHRAPVEAAALADPEAALRRLREAPPVLAEREVRLDGGSVVVRPRAEVLVGGIGVDLLARVHRPARVPDRLELAERLVE